MGYYSQVGIHIKSEGDYTIRGLLMAFFIEYPEHTAALNELIEEGLNHDLADSKEAILKIDSIKWYETFPNVKAFEKFGDWINSNENLNVGIHFLRIGEELDDNEVGMYGNIFNSTLYISRTIEQYS